MQIEVDPLSAVPIYLQIRDRIVEAIAAGRLKPGDQLSSVRQLALAFGINVATVGKAYDVLRQEGVIRTNQKSGSVVARGPGDAVADHAFVDAWAARLATLLAEALVQGVRRESILSAAAGILDGFAAGHADGSGTGSADSDGSGMGGSGTEFDGRGTPPARKDDE